MSTKRPSEATRAAIERQALFEEMADDDLEALLSMASVRLMSKGVRLFEEGEPGHAMYVVLEGTIEITKQLDRRVDVLAVRGPGEVIGEMSVLSAAPRSATATALEEARLLEIDQEAFRTLMASSGTAAMTIVHTMAGRLRTTEAALQQHRKLASLGTMAAGLAHELNNPAAALGRTVRQLQEALDGVTHALIGLIQAGSPGESLDALWELADRLAQRTGTAAEGAPSTPASTQGDSGDTREPWEREDAIQDALEQLNVGKVWELAPVLAGAGLGAEETRALLQRFPAAARTAAATFLVCTLDARSLLSDASTATQAISDIVQAVKSYSYLDQAPVQEIDLHKSLDDTLTILRHKMKQGVRVVREYGDNVSHIDAYGSELNQVWTNLIDNAVDAMEGRGVLTIRTRSGSRHVAVEICDDGPGIPDDLAANIFDPFFTTKPMGEGTGLGLHTAHRIVERHHGKLTLQSRGDGAGTCACVTLPRTMDAIRRDES